MKSRLLFFLLVFCSVSLKSFAGEAYQIMRALPNKRITAFVGSKSHNRISVEGDNIYQIIGDDRLYKIIYGAFRNHFFIVPKHNMVKEIYLSLVTDKNNALDLNLKVQNEEEGKTIIILFEQ